MSWRDLAGIASELAGDARRAVDRALGKTGAYRSVGYRGYGTSDRALVLGRILEHTRIASAEASHSRWRNLLAMVQRIDADPLPFARVRARFGGGATEVVADDEGFVRQWLSSARKLGAGEWHQVQLEVLAGPDTPIESTADVPAR